MQMMSAQLFDVPCIAVLVTTVLVMMTLMVMVMPHAGLAAALQLPGGAANDLDPHDVSLLRSVQALLSARDMGSVSIKQVIGV
jgi:hypothetical protein